MKASPRIRLACLLGTGLAVFLAFHWLVPRTQSVEQRAIDPKLARPNSSDAARSKRRQDATTITGTHSSSPFPLTPSENKLVVELSARLALALQAIEKANTETAFEFEGPNESTIAMRVTVLNEEQTRQAYLTAANLVNSAPKRLQAAFDVKSRALLTEYTTFIKPYKILIMSASPTGADVLFVEKFVSSPNEGLPDKSGVLNLKASDGYRLDSSWGTEESWAFRRYRHLFALEAGGEKSNSPAGTIAPAFDTR